MDLSPFFPLFCFVLFCSTSTKRERDYEPYHSKITQGSFHSKLALGVVSPFLQLLGS